MKAKTTSSKSIFLNRDCWNIANNNKIYPIKWNVRSIDFLQFFVLTAEKEDTPEREGG